MWFKYLHVQIFDCLSINNILPCDGDGGERWDEEQEFHGDLIKERTAQLSPHC